MDSEQGRNKGIRKDDGKIYKGTLTEAPLKLKASSIPSKIQNVVFNNHHKAAFGNSQQRFHTRTADMLVSTPGPGNYHPSPLKGKVDSKKGFGFFASQTKLARFEGKRNWNPGPGRYQVQKATSRKRSNSTVNLSSNIQARQLFESQLRATKDNPGPGNYEQRLLRSRTTIGSVFKSKDKRFSDSILNTPGVGQYNWQKVKQKVSALKFNYSKSNDKIVEKSFHKKYYDKIVGGGPQDSAREIGPGKYEPSLLDTRKTFSIRQDNRNRFGETQRDRVEMDHEAEPQPLSSATTPVKQVNAHGSVFKSKYKRYEFGQFQSKIMGDPWRYNPGKTNKHSHLVNFGKKWV